MKNSTQEKLSKTTRMHRASVVLSLFEGSIAPAMEWLRSVYGTDSSLIEEKREMVTDILREYLDHYGDEEILLSRSPGRLNVMGRHIDHQGGNCDVIAIDKEVFLAVGLRSDSLLDIHNVDFSKFPDHRVNLKEFPVSDYPDWITFIESEGVREYLKIHRGSWANYFIGVILRFHMEFPEVPITGMNLCAKGCIPIGGGLSSSSALVVAMMEVLTTVFCPNLKEDEFVRLCGEAEWFVGTRGGAGDHAAMKFSKRDTVTQIGFFPVQKKLAVPWNPDYGIAVFHSGISAKKTEGARDIFNQRVCCYQLAKRIWEKELPNLSVERNYLRDYVYSETISVSDLKKLLNVLPESLPSNEVITLAGGLENPLFHTHNPMHFKEYAIRSVALFGLSECLRSNQAMRLLKENDIAGLGRLMDISHDGDRVSRWSYAEGSEQEEPFIPDGRLLWENLSAKENLAAVSGSYYCSHSKIDYMVDLALSVPGVLGAQIAGAGLGGSMMVLLKNTAYDNLSSVMKSRYYQSSDSLLNCFLCRNVSGSGVFIP